MRALARVLLCLWLLWELPAGDGWPVDGKWIKIAGFTRRDDCEAARRSLARQRALQGRQVVTIDCRWAPDGEPR